jgi:phosphoglycerate dehydrogenase-like enzyme
VPPESAAKHPRPAARKPDERRNSQYHRNVRITQECAALTPYTPATYHVINAEVFAAMKPDAYFINLARGGVLDEAALLAALHEKRIAGAALDVFEQEPLKPDNPLWDIENVIITCHQAATHGKSGTIDHTFRE